MATVASTTTDDFGAQDGAIYVYTWTPLTTTNADGQPVRAATWTDRAVQISGTFGVGGTVVVEGSNDGTNYYTLNNAQGTAASFTAAGLRQITECPLYMRPRVTGGDGTTSITAVMVVRHLNTLRK